MSLVEFTFDKQTAFRVCLARAASVLSEDVAIDKIESIDYRRHLLVESIRIEASVRVADKAAADRMRGRLTADKIKSELSEAGLRAASVLVSAESQSDMPLSTPIHANSSVPMIGNAAAGDLLPAISGGAVAGCVLLMAMLVCTWYRCQNSFFFLIQECLLRSNLNKMSKKH